MAFSSYHHLCSQCLPTYQAIFDKRAEKFLMIRLALGAHRLCRYRPGRYTIHRARAGS